MLVFVRAAIYSSLFIASILVFIPAQLLGGAGIVRPAAVGALRLVGMAAVTLGAAVALWCIATFAVEGRGTPAPFDPPRRLVVRGPYRLVRNPMYLGAGLALAGAAVVYRSVALVVYLLVLALITQALVVLYEEPTLGRQFGADYLAYCQQVRRWLPRLPGSPLKSAT
jgi:protein-S-isoprenylcysteine O-methyltransferase Ste14